MLVDEELSRAQTETDTVVTVGVFDGMHRGHQHLMARLLQEAATNGLTGCVVTLYPHPQRILQPGFSIAYLSPLAERIRLIQEQGIPLIITVTFTKDLSLLRPEEFIRLLRRYLRMKVLVVGPDFALGKDRQGDVAFLRRLGEQEGFAVHVVAPVRDEFEVVSSSAIRQALQAGDMARAARLLGRGVTLEGIVVPGVQRGRILGIPTANLEVDAELMLPADGIYACWVYVSGRKYAAASSIGVRPTFGEGLRTVEVHLLDFRGDLYGQKLRVEMVQRLRDELRFDSVEALTQQMLRDIEQVRGLLLPPR